MRSQAFFASDEVIEEEAARLLADFYALYELEMYTIFIDPRDTFYDLQGKIGDRLERSLLTLAALARVNGDGGEGLTLHTERHPDGVGRLVAGDKESILTAREACNKIIHAKHASFVFDQSMTHPIIQHLLERDLGEFERAYKRPKIKLAGDRGVGREWSAEIDVVRWVHAVLHFSTAYAKPA